MAIINVMSYVLHLLNLKRAHSKIGDLTAFYVIGGVILAIYLTLTILLLQKPFRDKYPATKKMWLTIIILVGLYLVDRILLFIIN